MRANLFKLFLLSFTLVLAVADETKPAATLAAGSSIGASIFRMLGALALVVALLFGVAWFLRNSHRFNKGAAQRKLHILEARTLGARQAVYVVAYEQQRLLIGATPQGLSLLTHLPDGAPQVEGERIVPVSFGDALMQALGRK
jgi:flagellar protein FliO/FliZ